MQTETSNTTSKVIGFIIIVIAVGTVVFAKFGQTVNYSAQATPSDTPISTPVDTTANTPTNNPVNASSPVATPKNTPTPSKSPTASGYTMADVAKHNSASSCWSAINGNVYDLTKWINQHPGGPSAILSLCGKDGSAAFNGQHGGQRRPASELSGFEIGPLI